jgi:hypothetical protein
VAVVVNQSGVFLFHAHLWAGGAQAGAMGDHFGGTQSGFDRRAPPQNLLGDLGVGPTIGPTGDSGAAKDNGVGMRIDAQQILRRPGVFREERGDPGVFGNDELPVNGIQPFVVGEVDREFYAPAPPDTRSDWLIDADVGDGAGMDRNPWGVAYRTDAILRRAVIRGPEAMGVAMTTRKCVREALIDHCERQGYVMLHASALASADHVWIIVGNKGSGKTTLALRGALTHGLRMASNDHLIVYPCGGSLVVTSLPTPIPVKIGTYLDLEQHLSQPWDDEGRDIEAFRQMPRRQLFQLDRRVLYTFSRLGQDNPIEVPLGETTVVLADYAAPDEPVGRARPVDDPLAALLPHVRSDWMFDPLSNTHHLPRHERGRTAYGKDARRLVARLAMRSRVVSWRHHGEIEPLLKETLWARP